MISSGKRAKAQRHRFHEHAVMMIFLPWAWNIEPLWPTEGAGHGLWRCSSAGRHSALHPPLLFSGSPSRGEHPHAMHRMLTWVLSYFSPSWSSSRKHWVWHAAGTQRCLLIKWGSKKLMYHFCNWPEYPMQCRAQRYLSLVHNMFCPGDRMGSQQLKTKVFIMFFPRGCLKVTWKPFCARAGRSLGGKGGRGRRACSWSWPWISHRFFYELFFFF